MKKCFQKRYMVAWVFCIYLFLFCLLFFFLKKEGFSENEKRYLAEPPKISVNALVKNTFGKEFETYLSDHFPGRTFFVGANAYYDLYSGRNGSSGIYACKDDYLIAKPYDYDQEKLAKNMKKLNDLAKTTGKEMNMMIVPSTGYLMESKLPRIHEEYPDDKVFADMDALRSESVKRIDLIPAFKEAAGNQQLYYKTDHHWTTSGAYTAYLKYCEAAGLEPVSKESYTVESYQGFYGTSYSKSALWLKQPDTIEVWKKPGDVTVEIPETKTVQNSYFFPSHLKEADKYPVFLDGNHGFTKISNPDAGNKKLLLIKDSFAHAAAPFLSEHYGEIYMVDLRYYKQSFSKLVSDEKIDDILVLYGINTFINDTNFVWMK